ncbi:MAG: phasin family protein [Actinomycetota bacterium]
MLDELRRIALFTSGVAELSRNRAEELVKGLVRSGELRREQTASWVKNLVEVSRENREELVRFVRAEIRDQIANVGLATKRDFERLERRVARLESQRKSTRRKTASKKNSGRKATSGTSHAS